MANFSILTSHVLVPPAIEAILSRDDNTVQGFLAAGHVCTIMGTASTMASMVEALGIGLPGNAAYPAVDGRRNVLARNAGRRISASLQCREYRRQIRCDRLVRSFRDRPALQVLDDTLADGPGGTRRFLGWQRHGQFCQHHAQEIEATADDLGGTALHDLLPADG